MVEDGVVVDEVVVDEVVVVDGVLVVDECSLEVGVVLLMQTSDEDEVDVEDGRGRVGR